MKSILSLMVMMFWVTVYSQDNFKLYYEETATGFKILADNEEYSPVSAKIDFRLENLSSTNGTNKVYIIPAKTKRHTITDLNVIDRKKRIRLGYESIYNHGNHNQKEYDVDFQYYLPFKKNSEYWLSQGYNGAISHKNENALDFKMPIGTKIYAARGGVVVDIEESFSKSCTTGECVKYNNFIVIYHADGTFAEYTHIKKDGAEIHIGDQVTAGQFIGYSGNVGWATGPHLHFIVFLQKLKERKTLKTKFRIGNGDQAITLVEKEKYKRTY
ncbi:M23 family metallopeptidase [Aquimarina longa]|uniref:M23 family metallopeptidase n=1 Tax=Aquimarina longa TaxID=1080221 RepID=UPI0007852CF1|nr:M23 family metallopeptidase [Aquimarina longa]